MSIDPDVQIGFLERVVDDLEREVKVLRDENARLLGRALSAENRIIDHYESKNNPDEVDRRLWGGDRLTWVR